MSHDNLHKHLLECFSPCVDQLLSSLTRISTAEQWENIQNSTDLLTRNLLTWLNRRVFALHCLIGHRRPAKSEDPCCCFFSYSWWFTKNIRGVRKDRNKSCMCQMKTMHTHVMSLSFLVIIILWMALCVCTVTDTVYTPCRQTQQVVEFALWTVAAVFILCVSMLHNH